MSLPLLSALHCSICCYTHYWRSCQLSFSSFADAKGFGRLHHIGLKLHALSLYLGMLWWLLIFLASSFPLEAFPTSAFSFLAFPGCPAQALPAYQFHVGLEDASPSFFEGRDRKAIRWRSLFSSLGLHQLAGWVAWHYIVCWYFGGRRCIGFLALLPHGSYWQYRQCR